jgi:hypothetical protein
MKIEIKSHKIKYLESIFVGCIESILIIIVNNINIHRHQIFIPYNYYHICFEDIKNKIYY